MSKNVMPVYFNQNYKLNKRKLKMKKNAMDPVNYEEEKKNDPKYKTELCKSFMETNFCVYGNKCRFAHGYKDLVVKKQINNYKQKLCNSFFKKGFCPYGNRCNFKHDERKLKDISIPYYYSHLISLHVPQLITGKRLPVFEELTKRKFENIAKETNNELVEKCTEILKKNLMKKEENEKEKENEEKKDELSNSFFSEKSSRENSISESPIKSEEKDDINYTKNTEFFLLGDLNFALDIFSNEN